MWASLCIFIYFRKESNRKSGVTNQEHIWSFGQVLGLVTWVPVLVEFVYIWKNGPKEALTGQLMAPYQVVSDNELPVITDSTEVESLEHKCLLR